MKDKPITEFQGEFRWLSNFEPCQVELDGMPFRTVEHAYVAAKTLDTSIRVHIQFLETPGQAKRFGRGLVLRPDWEEIKLGVMRDLVRQKFKPGSYLADKLVATGNRQIVEGNNWGDQFWGVSQGKGKNHLGRIIMEVRGSLLREL